MLELCIIAACHAVSYPAWCSIFREISCFFSLNIVTLFRCCVQCAEMAAGLYALRGVEMHTNKQVQ